MRNWFVALVVLLVPYGLLFGRDEEKLKAGDIDLRKIKMERGESVWFHKGSGPRSLSVHKDNHCKGIDIKSPAPLAGLLFVEKGGDVKHGIVPVATELTVRYCVCSEEKPGLSREPIGDLHAIDAAKGVRIWVCKGKIGELVAHGKKQCESIQDETSDGLIVTRDKETYILALMPENLRLETCTACYKDKATIVDELFAASKMEKYIAKYKMNLLTEKDTSIDKNKFMLVSPKELLKKVREKFLEEGDSSLRVWHDAMRSAETWTDALDNIRLTATLSILELAYSLK